MPKTGKNPDHATIDADVAALHRSFHNYVEAQAKADDTTAKAMLAQRDEIAKRDPQAFERAGLEELLGSSVG